MERFQFEVNGSDLKCILQSRGLLIGKRAFLGVETLAVFQVGDVEGQG